MKSPKTLIIILLSAGVVLVAVSAILIFAVGFEGAIADLLFFAFILGISSLLASLILFVLKRKQGNRSEIVLGSFKNLGEGIYVQGICGNNNHDKSNAVKNATSFAGALCFAAAFGAGVYFLSDSRSRMEFVIIGNEMYAGEIRQSAFLGYEYSSVDDMRTVYKGWFARHTLTKKRKEIIMTGADGQCYLSFDLNSCTVGEEQLLSALENVFGKAVG